MPTILAESFQSPSPQANVVCRDSGHLLRDTSNVEQSSMWTWGQTGVFPLQICFYNSDKGMAKIVSGEPEKSSHF